MKPIVRRSHSVGGERLVLQALAFALIVVACLSAVHLMAEIASTGHITGTVIDAKSQKPLGFANVVVGNGPIGTMSIEDGTFEINDVPAGTQILRVMMMGYRTVIDTVKVYADSTVSLEYALEETVVATMQEILVQGERKNVGVSSSDVRSSRTFSDSVDSCGQGSCLRPTQCVSRKWSTTSPTTIPSRTEEIRSRSWSSPRTARGMKRTSSC